LSVSVIPVNLGEKALSLNKFASIAMQDNLFSKEKQLAFANAISQAVKLLC